MNMEVTERPQAKPSRLLFTEVHVRALFVLVGIKVLSVHELPNGYWPDAEDYSELRRVSPWFLVETEAGLIKIGWRKRVLSIDWSRTDMRVVVTAEDVTKNQTMVHAWSYAKAVEYLTVLSAHHS